ncbi:hypothetical protein [Mycolicibacterium phocaicum]|uniref:hypothetical protein n=1 Tax=Mycolicibacterium phocaicum TaxID=319706 RepID=UPI001CFC0C97|nr:hypothetical protein [Mycolicibacterium phocaicum]UCZ58658.1 hypothetical protein LHJ73_17945 [Mycolicibacterium phocaicum]
MTVRSKPLRAVGDGETAAPKPPKSVAEAAKSGTPRELLIAMRDRIAVTVSDPTCQARDLAALTKRLQDIANAIEAMDAREDSQLRVRELEVALQEVAPNHPLISNTVDDTYDASVV